MRPLPKENQIHIRPVVPGDILQVTEWLVQDEYMRQMLQIPEDTAPEIQRRLVAAMNSTRAVWVAGEAQGAVVGYAWATDISPSDRSAVVNYLIGPGLRGMGRLLVDAAVAWGFEVLGLRKLTSLMPVQLSPKEVRAIFKYSGGNMLSLNTQQRVGFRYAGVIPMILTAGAD